MGTILTISGMSGIGKTTSAKELLHQLPCARMVPSYTTRPPRRDDIKGEYVRPGKTKIDQLAKEGRLLWREQHGDQVYATVRSDVARILNEPETIGVMILLPQSILKLAVFLEELHRGGSRTSVFLVPPPWKVLGPRLNASRRDITQITARWSREVLWEQWARDSDLGFHFVHNEGTIEETTAAIRALVS